MVFINLTNHGSGSWSEAQKEAASRYGEILDLPFPAIEPEWTSDEVNKLAEEYVDHILSMDAEPTVLCQGEFTFSYSVIHALLEKGVKVLAACSRRETEEVQDGEKTRKTAVFRFVRFREYI